MPMLLYVGTYGPDDPTLACMPFALALATAEEGIRTMVHVRGDAVVLLRDDAIATVAPVDLPPLRELLRHIRERCI
ncbi:MAG: hypothetical protein C4345_02895, partial [Chloroflexota bacterium]